MEKWKRLLSIILCLSSLLCLLPSTTLTANADTTEQWLWPLDDCYIVLSNFGYRDLNNDGVLDWTNPHRGIDIIRYPQDDTRGMPVRAAKSGTIITSKSSCPHVDYKDNCGCNGGAGNYIVIQHPDGTYTRYLHMLQEGLHGEGYVSQGETIGYVGTSGWSYGYHLHFEILDSSWTPMNPMPTNSEITIWHEYSLPSGWASAWTTYILDPTPTYVTQCTSYPSYSILQITDSTCKIKSLPCSVNTDPTSETVEVPSVGDKYTAVKLYKNTAGNCWYQVDCKNGKTGYLYAGDCAWIGNIYSDVTGSGIDVPSSLTQGAKYPVTGSVSATYNMLSEVSVYIYPGSASSGNPETGDKATIDTNYYNLQNLDSNVEYNTLPAGTHNFVVKATAYGYYASSTTSVQRMQYTSVVKQQSFSVFSGAQPDPTVTITFDPNGGNCSTGSKTVTPGSAYGTLPTPTRSDYGFDGWYTAASGGTRVTSSTIVTANYDHTLYAHWVSLETYVNKGQDGKYVVGEPVTISTNATNYNSVHLYVYYTPSGGDTVKAFDGQFSSAPIQKTFDSPGYYSCYLIVHYSGGDVRSSWVGWSVSEAKATINKGQNGKYVVGEPVTINTNATGYNSAHLYVYYTPSGGETVKAFEGQFSSMPIQRVFDSPGYYSCRLTLHYSGGDIQTSWVGWSVYEAKAEVDKGQGGKYVIGEPVTISTNATNYNSARLYIYYTPSGGETVTAFEGQFSSLPIQRVFDSPGYYSCFLILYYNSGSIQTSWVGWSVYEAKTTVNKGQDGKYIVGEPVTISTNATDYNSVHLYVYFTPSGGKTVKAFEGQFSSAPIQKTFDSPGYYSGYLVLHYSGSDVRSSWVGWSVVTTSSNDGPNHSAYCDRGNNGTYFPGDTAILTTDAINYDSLKLRIVFTPPGGETTCWYENACNDLPVEIILPVEFGYGHYACCFVAEYGGISYSGNWVGWDTVECSHDFWYIPQAIPTIESEGVLHGCCSICGKTEDITLPKLNNEDYSYVIATPATCTSTGTGSYTWNVDAYGTFSFDVTIPIIPHNYTETLIAPNCTEQGYIMYSCSVCGDSFTDGFTDALGHDWNEPSYTWTDDNNAVTATRSCARDESHVETETVSTIFEVTKEATYEEEGEITYTATFENAAFVTQTKAVATPKLVKPDDGLPCDGGDDCPGNKFTDIPAKGHWAHDPIDWAIVTGVTSGTSETAFSPNAGCTRAQVVTFLWRAAGSPEPSSSNPFTDVTGGYYYKAVLWAVENNITSGTSATTFSPNSTCTRAQIVTFLWRFEGSPAPKPTNNPFTDVEPGSYYEKAVLWASESGVTAGTSATTFSPDATCTRAQVVTFLYRNMVK